ncbi:MAG: hypothetical protein GXO72_00330 [Caldiserica bacterium]|nr:hypothetical protein [Caldisericota bacterium]
MVRGVVAAIGVVLLAGYTGVAQWGGLTAYPGGYLLMTYHITTPEGAYTYTLELTPKEDGTYTVRTEVLGEASLEELSDVGLFFTWQPSVWFAQAWWLPHYLMLRSMGGPLEPGRTYVLFGGISFVTEDYVTVAGVKAVKGILTSPGAPDERVVLAIAPDPAVPYPVLIRQERKEGGDWVPKYEMVLVKYEHR